MSDEFDTSKLLDETKPIDVPLGDEKNYKVRNFLIYQVGTTTWFNAGNSPIVTIDQSGGVTATGIVSGSAGVFAANMTSATVATGAVGCATVVATGSVQAPLGIFASLAAPFKLFDIKHPSPNKEGKRLRHGSLEGPELAVYVRGKTKENVITLPDYWQDLIDPESITVQLTATQPNQELYVQSTSASKVEVQGKTDYTYYYYIMAERKDVPKLEVEIDAEHDYGF